MYIVPEMVMAALVAIPVGLSLGCPYLPNAIVLDEWILASVGTQHPTRSLERQQVRPHPHLISNSTEY